MTPRARHWWSALAALAAFVCLLPAAAPLAAAATPSRKAASTPARPDAALYRQAQAAETRLRGSAARTRKRAEWESVVLQ